MKLSVLINLYGNKTLDETLKIMSEQGITTVEVGAGGYPGKAHCDPAALLADDAKLEEFKNTFKKYNITICALACHGNALHPDKELAKMYDTDFKNACLLAEKLGVDTGDKVMIIWDGERVSMMNPAVYAMRWLREELKGEGEKVGLSTEEEINAYCKEIRNTIGEKYL